MSRSSTLRVIAVLALLSAAFFAALPWLGCSSFGRVNGTLSGYVEMMRVCTFPSTTSPNPEAYGLPGFTGPYWGNLIVGIAYLAGAVYVAVSKRI